MGYFEDSVACAAGVLVPCPDKQARTNQASDDAKRRGSAETEAFGHPTAEVFEIPVVGLREQGEVDLLVSALEAREAGIRVDYAVVDHREWRRFIFGCTRDRGGQLKPLVEVI